MFESAQLMSFVAAVAVLVIVPGPNTFLILTHSLSGGRAAGLATVLGVETGTLVHTTAAAFGLSAILSTSALAFLVVKYVGAAYLVYLGLQALRSGTRGLAASPSPVPITTSRAYGRAVLTNVLNPKVAMFFLAFLPPFIHPERGRIALQVFVLGLVVSMVGLVFGVILATMAGSLAAWLSRSAIARWLQRVTGCLLLGLGVRLAFVHRE